MADIVRDQVDVFPDAREEPERMLSEGNSFVREALANGKEVQRGSYLLIASRVTKTNTPLKAIKRDR